jgi:hypothetical protein
VRRASARQVTGGSSSLRDDARPARERPPRRSPRSSISAAELKTSSTSGSTSSRSTATELPAAEDGHAEELSDELGDRIERHVLDMVERRYPRGRARGGPRGQVNMLRHGHRLIELLLVILTIVIAIWLVKTILF